MMSNGIGIGTRPRSWPWMWPHTCSEAIQAELSSVHVATVDGRSHAP